MPHSPNDFTDEIKAITHAMALDHASRYDADKAIPSPIYRLEGVKKLKDGRAIPEGWGIVPSKLALEHQAPDGWNIVAPEGFDLPEFLSQDEAFEWSTPEQALDMIETLIANAEHTHQHTEEVTAMTHPAHTGPALNEIKKMIQLLESGEWADTFPTTAEGQRLEKVINDMIALQRKSDADGHRMADQLQDLRAKPESSRLAYEEMEALRSVFETNDIDALKAFEPKFAISSVWQTSLYDRMQEHAKREAELRRLVAETDLKAISAPEPAPVAQPYYTLEDKIVDLAIDVIAGVPNAERAKVLLREIIKEAKA